MQPTQNLWPNLQLTFRRYPAYSSRHTPQVQGSEVVVVTAEIVVVVVVVVVGVDKGPDVVDVDDIAPATGVSALAGTSGVVGSSSDVIAS